MAETRYKLVSDLIDLICEIDGVPIPSVTSIEYTHEVNAGRTISISMANLDQRQVARLGAIITLKVGQNDVTQDDSHNLDFTGIIVQASPSIQTTTVVAIDYITFLQTSEYIEYKNSDIVGQDLYFLAADACNYKDIDTSILLKGSGIVATEAMELDGLQTRRQFLDKCFENMEVFLDDSEHNQVAVGVWRYAIKRNRVMDFWFEDPTNKKYQTAIISISEKSPNLIGDGLITNIDITQIVNSATYHNNTDSSIYATVTDNDSVRRYGIRSKLFPSSLDEKGKLEMLAYQVVTRFKEPTFDYEITLKDAEHITVGDYIKIKNIAYEKEETLPVVKVFHSFTDTIVSKITVGNPERSLKDYIEIGLS